MSLPSMPAPDHLLVRFLEVLHNEYIPLLSEPFRSFGEFVSCSGILYLQDYFSMSRFPQHLVEAKCSAFLSRFHAGSFYLRVRHGSTLPLYSCYEPHNISTAKNTDFSLIYPPSLHPLVRLVTGLRDNMRTYPQWAVSVLWIRGC